MYSFGSVVAVGSWFFISVTSSVRKSLAEMVDDELLVELVSAASASGLALEVAFVPDNACAAVVE
jgi:hypothetical protein